MARLGPASATVAAAATVPVALVMMVFCLLLGRDMIHARQQATYIVGGDDGWNLVIPMYTWPRGKTFYAGDILVFKYDSQENNVVVVNRTGYDRCQANDRAKVYDSGNDKIQLAFGMNYFIGTYNPNDCAAGLKMAVKALAPLPASRSLPVRMS